MGRCKGYGCERACREGRECRRRAEMAGAYAKCWHKSGRLERAAWKGQEILEKTWKNAAPQEQKRP